MDLNPFSIVKTVGQVLKNRDHYESLAKELENKIIVGESESVRIHLALKTGRFVKLEGSASPNPNHIIAAVNQALDLADTEWARADHVVSG